MTVLAWLLLGLVAGFLASKLMTGSGKGLLIDLVLGVVGAFVGGALFHLVGHVGVTGFNLWSLLVSVLGAVVVLTVFRALTSNPPSTKPS